MISFSLNNIMLHNKTYVSYLCLKPAAQALRKHKAPDVCSAEH